MPMKHSPQSNKITSYFSPTKPSISALNLDRLEGGSQMEKAKAGNRVIGTTLPAKRKDFNSNSGLKKCFTALVDKKQVNLELEVLQLMLRKEMQVPLETLEPELATILPYLLVHYIKTWPGWQRSSEYYGGTITFKDWYEKFNKYILLKLNHVIKDSFKEGKAEFNKKKMEQHQNLVSEGKKVDRNTQTDNLAPKGVAPFTIEIFAPPVWLNSVVFSENAEGSVILKQHSVPDWDAKTIETITLKQIITWPHVTVNFSSGVLSFTRANVPYYERQISVAANTFPSTSRPHVEEVIQEEGKTQEVYTLNYIKHVANQLLAALETLEKPTTIFKAFRTVIEEFLLDLEEINICINDKITMATNTSVTFNLGKQAYFRNKKLSKGSAPSRHDISYMELIVPRIQICLSKLANTEELTTYLNSLTSEKNAPNPTLSPEINFRCNFCDIDFVEVQQLALHLRTHHKMEQPVLCLLCKKNFFATVLTSNRYSHVCNGKK